MININIKKGLVLGGVALAAVALSACTQNTGQTQDNSQSQSQAEQTTQSPEAENTVIYSDQGFPPAELKVKVGDAVTFKNDSSNTVEVNSAPHPVHTDFPALNIGQIAAGESKTVTFTDTGTKKYHNHLNPSQFGTIVVE